MKRGDKTAQKRQLLIDRTAAALAVPHAQAEALLARGTSQSFRVRGEADAVVAELAAAGWAGQQYPWYPQGYSIDGDKAIVSESRAAAKGQIYIQNAASWLPVLALEPQPGESVLDMCAAPGGKAAHVYDSARGDMKLWVNDNSYPRMRKMQRNFEQLGIGTYHYSLHDATKLSRHIPHESFDKILLDAPCSGEGMMRLDRAKDFLYWSPSQIKRLQAQQKQLIREAWQLLRPGGTLIYSTCTIAPEENEAIIDYALRRLDGVQLVPWRVSLPNAVSTVAEWNGRQFDERVRGCLRLAPSQAIEAFFVAKLVKQA